MSDEPIFAMRRSVNDLRSALISGPNTATEARKLYVEVGQHLAQANTNVRQREDLEPLRLSAMAWVTHYSMEDMSGIAGIMQQEGKRANNWMIGIGIAAAAIAIFSALCTGGQLYYARLQHAAVVADIQSRSTNGSVASQAPASKSLNRSSRE